MRFGLWLRCGSGESPTELIERAETAEKAGWDGVFVSDQLAQAAFPDPWVVLAGMATRTQDITLGTWVVPIPRRQPVQIANELASLDRLAEGRLMFGAGLGNRIDYEGYGRAYEPAHLADRLEESLSAIDALWSGDPVTFEGEHVTLTEGRVRPTPLQESRVPMLLGAWWPNKGPFRRAAQWDGIMPYYASFTDDSSGPHGEAARGTPMEEIEDSLTYYHDIATDPGEILLPAIPGSDPTEYLAQYKEWGATWTLMTRDTDDLERIRAGPPE